MVEWLFLAVPWGCFWFVIVVFPNHTHLLFLFCSLRIHLKPVSRDAEQNLKDFNRPGQRYSLIILKLLFFFINVDQKCLVVIIVSLEFVLSLDYVSLYRLCVRQVKAQTCLSCTHMRKVPNFFKL